MNQDVFRKLEFLKKGIYLKNIPKLRKLASHYSFISKAYSFTMLKFQELPSERNGLGHIMKLKSSRTSMCFFYLDGTIEYVIGRSLTF